MTSARSAIDAMLAMFAVLAWGFAVFAFGARWFSAGPAAVVALAVVLSAGATVLSMHLRDRRLLALTSGTCPSCGAGVEMEHRHRLWDTGKAAWAAPSTAWDCSSCGYSHAEGWPCPQCPQP